jgi:hypothetical protein
MQENPYGSSEVVQVHPLETTCAIEDYDDHVFRILSKATFWDRKR